MDSSNYPYEDIDNDDMSEEEEFDIDPETKTGKERKRKAAHGKGGGVSKPRKKVAQRSDVWQHFIKLRDNEKRCNCRHCGKEMACPSTNGTSNLKKHLKSCNGYKVILESKDQTTLSKEDDGSLTYGKVSEAVFREATNELLVLAELPLSFTEGVGWKHFCNKAKLYKPHSRRTASRDIVQLYLQRKEELKRLVSGERVSLTTDIWLNEYTNASYMVITAHWIDANWYLRKLIIGFKHVEDHTSKTIASTLLGCLADWGIKKVFTITVDNATANTSALNKFRQEFKTVGSEAMVLGGEMIHMRCAAHILNLVVKDGFKEVDESVLAIRNAVKYVKSGPNRQKSFNQRADSIKVSGGSVQLDMETRWNATYVMLTRALNHKLVFDQMEAEDKKYNEYFKEKEDGKKREGPPTNDNWIAVDKFVRFLEIFHDATLVVSASESVNSHKCYAQIGTIQRSLTLLTLEDDSDLRNKAEVMRFKFDKYWDGIKDINKLVIVASVLDPTKKMIFPRVCFEELYGKESADCKDMEHSLQIVLTRLFQEYSTAQLAFDKIKTSSNVSQSQGSGASSQGTQEYQRMDEVEVDHGRKYETIDFIYRKIIREKGIQESSSELELYLKEGIENPDLMNGTEFDILSWWRHNSPKYPILAKLAKDVLAMQVSSVASESAFSTSGRVLDPYRSRLTHYMIEILMCTEQWLKSSLKLREFRRETTTQEMLSEITLLEDLEKEFGNGYQ